MNLPDSFSDLFKNYIFETLNDDKHAALVIKTVLSHGRWEQIVWLASIWCCRTHLRADSAETPRSRATPTIVCPPSRINRTAPSRSGGYGGSVLGIATSPSWAHTPSIGGPSNLVKLTLHKKGLSTSVWNTDTY